MKTKYIGRYMRSKKGFWRGSGIIMRVDDGSLIDGYVVRYITGPKSKVNPADYISRYSIRKYFEFVSAEEVATYLIEK